MKGRILIVPVEVILSRQARALEERSDEGKDPQVPERGLSVGTTKIPSLRSG